MFGLTGLSHTAHLLTVYASPPQSPTSTQDSFLAGGQPLPGGLNFSRQAPQEGFFDFVRYFIESSLHRLRLAH